MLPPASISMVLPSGETTSNESPWPTSIAVTSSLPGRKRGGATQNAATAAETNSADIPARAIARRQNTPAHTPREGDRPPTANAHACQHYPCHSKGGDKGTRTRPPPL